MAKLRFAHEATGTMEFQIQGNHRTLPFTIGIEGPDGMVMPLIRKGARLPKAFSEVYTTIASFQQNAYLHLTIGERPAVVDNVTLCVIVFSEGAFRMEGKARYELSLKATGNGKLVVKAENLDRARGAGHARIRYDEPVVTTAMIEQLRRDAEEGKAADGRFQERYDALAAARDEVRYLESELYPAAKRKMNFLTERRDYKAFCRKVYDLIELGPARIDEGQFEELGRLIDEELPHWQEVLQKRADQVFAWYSK